MPPDTSRTSSIAARVTVALLMLAGIVNFLDRSSLSIANRTIRTELSLSATQMGLLLSAFSLAYGFMQLPIGPLLDRFGARRVLGVGLTVWSSAQMLTGLVTGMAAFIPMRILLGLGEAPFFPASVKLVRESFSDRNRGRGMAAVNISTTIGQAIAPPFLTILMLHLGWRPMFLLIGGLGLILALAWFLIQRDDAPTQATTEPSITLHQWTSLFRLRAVWGLMLGFGGINYTAWFYIAWLPSYLQTERHVSVAASGWLTAIPFLAGSLGMLTSGLLADAASRRGTPLPTIHLRQIVTGMALSAAFTLFASHAATAASAVACISGALFSIHFAGTSSWGYVQAASPRPLVATISSLQNFGSFVIASIAPILTGATLDRTHSYTAAFALCAAVALIGCASYLFIVRGSTIPPTPRV